MQQRTDYKMISCIKVCIKYQTMPLSTGPLIQQVEICRKRTRFFSNNPRHLGYDDVGKSWTELEINIR